jgi:hypothetical protein
MDLELRRAVQDRPAGGLAEPGVEVSVQPLQVGGIGA